MKTIFLATTSLPNPLLYISFFPRPPLSNHIFPKMIPVTASMGSCLLFLRKYYTCIIFSQNLSPFGLKIVDICLKTCLSGYPVMGGFPGDIRYNLHSGLLHTRHAQYVLNDIALLVFLYACVARLGWRYGRRGVIDVGKKEKKKKKKKVLAVVPFILIYHHCLDSFGILRRTRTMILSYWGVLCLCLQKWKREGGKRELKYMKCR